ncbi:M48 family metallopeptidase [Thermodesulfatator atlanticus]|uniref:M48 family metallopeptidase n=1 Tax=Thermodesulfatator atlanticus TaxID=501497 RepID=UPI0003B4821B|nr:M48 family metallopeptidase [Thermodesulfatator atlanticus]
MLYTDAIYLILAILLFSGWPAQAVLTWPEVLALWVLKEICFIGITLFKLKKTYSPIDFIRTQSLLKLFAFLWFSLDVILLEIPAFLPFQKEFLKDLSGLILFFHYLFLIWWLSALYEKRSALAKLSPSSYVISHFKLLLPFLIPWFLINLLFFVLEKHLPVSGIWAELFYFGCFVGALVVLMAPLAVRAWNCRPLPESNLRQLISSYLAREKARLGEIYLWETFDGRLLTAGVIGVIPKLRYLLISRGLLAALEEAEVLSVVAHEVGHIKRHHMFWLLVFFVLFSLIIYFVFMPLYLLFLAYFPRPDLLDVFGGQGLLLPEAFMTLGLLISVVLYFRFLLGFFLRNFERQADLYCLESLGTAHGLIKAFKKIAALSGNTEDLPSWHHYSIRQRIEFLLAAEKDPTLIAKHHQKVKKWLTFYLAFSLALILGLSRLPTKQLEEKAKLNLAYGEFLKEASIFPSKETFTYLGHLAYELGKEKDALKWYKMALKFEKDPEVLNNMAWILVTSKDKNLRNPKRALKLALEATSEKLTAIHLDTLAEAWFANKNPEKACLYSILAEARARLDPDYYPNFDYYIKQKERFCNAARSSSKVP